MVDARDLKSLGAQPHAGSSPAPGNGSVKIKKVKENGGMPLSVNRQSMETNASGQWRSLGDTSVSRSINCSISAQSSFSSISNISSSSISSRFSSERILSKVKNNDIFPPLPQSLGVVSKTTHDKSNVKRNRRAGRAEFVDKRAV